MRSKVKWPSLIGIVKIEKLCDIDTILKVFHTLSSLSRRRKEKPFWLISKTTRYCDRFPGFWVQCIMVRIVWVISVLLTCHFKYSYEFQKYLKYRKLLKSKNDWFLSTSFYNNFTQIDLMSNSFILMSHCHKISMPKNRNSHPVGREGCSFKSNFRFIPEAIFCLLLLCHGLYVVCSPLPRPFYKKVAWKRGGWLESIQQVIAESQPLGNYDESTPNQQTESPCFKGLRSSAYRKSLICSSTSNTWGLTLSFFNWWLYKVFRETTHWSNLLSLYTVP